LHVRGYKEKGNINTPMELAMNNETDRYTLAIDAIDRIPRLQKIGGHSKEKFRNKQIECRAYAYKNGIDAPEITGWKWPYRSK
jgi:xylulose-5-phosphate/fructose-6-phosphate phosphoketolase